VRTSGSEAERGCREVGALHRSQDAGEPTRGTLPSKEQRQETEPSERKMTATSSPTSISTKLERIAKLARDAPQMALTTLAHHIDLEWLHEAYVRTRKDGAKGVDGQSAEQYAENLEANLRSLLHRAKTGTYQAPPVRRVHIPKGEGSETRPIGIPTFEDKVLQRAVAMVLGAVYEQDFKDSSYGFRAGRSAHQALARMREPMVRWGGAWVVEMDIRKFFDTLDHALLQQILSQRVRDGVLLRLIGKWLHAGVMEDGSLSYPSSGSPQGGVISPLLANIFLHEVLDVWFERDVQSRLRERSALIRYADDAVLLFASEQEARRVLEVLPKRFEKYGLKLHPDKTRLIDFRRPDRQPPSNDDEPKGRGGTFDFLGFTYHWGKSLRGKWIPKPRTAKDRFRRALRRLVDWLREHRHWPVKQQHKTLTSKLRGHYAYYGISHNSDALRRLFYRVRRAWQKWLNRRSQRARMSWEKMAKLLERFPLLRPRILHPRQALRAANPVS
jgi:RNA-directed DNA polymerase